MSDTPIRRSPRLRHEVMVQVTSSRGTFSGWGTNLSLGGVFVNAQTAPPVDTQVEILLHLPGQAECKIRGRVAWTKEAGADVEDPGMGVQFLEPDEEIRRLLGEMVERLTQDLAGPSTSR
jgi:uncharacterized protein (TIGR02266 family)